MKDRLASVKLDTKKILLTIVLISLQFLVIAGQAYDISNNKKYHYLNEEIQFTKSNCSPEIHNKTDRKYFDLEDCSFPLDIKVNLKNSSSNLITNFLYLGTSSSQTDKDILRQELIEIILLPKSDSIIKFTITQAGSRFRPMILSSEYYQITRKGSVENTHLDHLTKRLSISFLTKGFFISFLIFTLFFLIQLKSAEFLFYFLFQLANIVYFSDLYWIHDYVSLDWLSKDSYRALIKTAFQPIIYIFYFRFLRSFLDTKSKFEAIDIWLRILEQSLILLVLISIGSFFINPNFYFSFKVISRVYMSIIGLGILIYFFMNRNELVSYLLLGGGALTIGSSLALLFSHYPNLLKWEGIYPLDFMIAGTIIEFFIFSFGLSYKMHIENTKFGKLQNELNKQLIDKQNIREKKLSSLAEQLSQVENDRKNMAVELKSLRSQLNPHFLFNSLNSLKKYILKNEINNATLYIDKFASLIRKMLSSSRKSLISLKDEIDALSIYLELENERLGFELKWEIIVDESLDTDEVFIPPILIQPFAENAIWHGLINKTDGIKELSISFEDKQPLQITIRDNGIGIKAAKELKSSMNNGKRKSLGTQMIQERIELIKKFYKVDASLKINEHPKGGGTEIQINIPELKT